MKHKVAIVTGGGSGTGREVARRLTADGVAVHIWGRTEEKLKSTVAEGLAFEYSIVDVAALASVEAAVERLVRAGAPTLFVHCAGVWTGGPLAEVGQDVLVAHVRSVVEGSINAARAALRLFDTGPGHFIQVAAASAKAGYPDTALNTLAKRAQDGLQEGLSRELRSSTIKVTTVYPDSIAASDSDAVASGTAMSYADVAEAVLFAVNAPDSMDVDEIVVTARRSGRWDA